MTHLRNEQRAHESESQLALAAHEQCERLLVPRLAHVDPIDLRDSTSRVYQLIALCRSFISLMLTSTSRLTLVQANSTTFIHCKQLTNKVFKSFQFFDFTRIICITNFKTSTISLGIL